MFLKLSLPFCISVDALKNKKVNDIVKMKGNLTVATTQRAESIANVIPNHQSNKPRASDIHQQSKNFFLYFLLESIKKLLSEKFALKVILCRWSSLAVVKGSLG